MNDNDPRVLDLAAELTKMYPETSSPMFESTDDSPNTSWTAYVLPVAKRLLAIEARLEGEVKSLHEDNALLLKELHTLRDRIEQLERREPEVQVNNVGGGGIAVADVVKLINACKS